MNDLAMYQLDRAIDALNQMKNFMGSDTETHSEHYYDFTRNDPSRSNPFEFTIQDKKYQSQYQDNPSFTESTKDEIYKNYRAAIDEWNILNDKYNSLVECHEELQDLFYRVDAELDELKVKYDTSQKCYRLVVSELNKCINDK